MKELLGLTLVAFLPLSDLRASDLLSQNRTQNTAEEQKPSDGFEVGSFFDEPFLVKETWEVKLDGNDSTKIERFVQTQSAAAYMNQDFWRARRELPIYAISREYLRDKEGLHWISPTNTKSDALDNPGDRVWKEIALSPLRLARQLGLETSEKDLTDWLKALRKKNSPLVNAEGDRVEWSYDEATKIWKIAVRGSLLTEDKGRIQVASIWEASRIEPQIAQSSIERTLTGL